MNDITKKTVAAHAESLRRREYSARELTTEYLKQIKERDGDIGAFLFVDAENALRDAEAADRMLEDGNENLLCGIPFAMKDNVLTKGIPTTCASKILENYIPPYDATVTVKLKSAGAVMLGKTNMDEFAMGSSTENSAFKKTVNPLDPERSPGGSSGGSAAAVAAGEAAFAIGSDTGGSVRQPASFCGLVGIKPTYGAVSRYGLAPLASSLDQIGPITKNCRDNAIVLSAICGKDPKDSTTLGYDWGDIGDGIGKDMRGLKIGVPADMLRDADRDVAAAVENALEIFRSMGCGIVGIELPSFEYAFSDYKVICSAEASSNMGRFDGIRYGESEDGELFFSTRSKLLGAEVKRRIMMGAYVLSAGNYDKYYGKALKVKTLIARETDAALEKCDVIITPAVSSTAFRIGEAPLCDGLYAGDSFCMASSLSGHPSLEVPCGKGEGGLPVGMLLSGRKFSEKLLFSVGASFERCRDE